MVKKTDFYDCFLLALQIKLYRISSIKFDIFVH